MDNVQIFWDPKGIELNQLGNKRKSGDPADGDTPYVRMPIRMLGIDTPETKYQVGEPKANERFAELKQLLETGNFDNWIQPKLKAHILPRLENAGTRQINQGNKAKDFFKELMDKRLTRESGSVRNLYVKSADTHFDFYGRLLAYIAPHYSKKELSSLSFDDKKTFNLLMIESGWASTIMIYPNLPKNSDLRLTQELAKKAMDDNKGAWEDDKMLTGYEYRMCMKLYKQCKEAKASNGFFIEESKWIARYCVDMTTLKVYNPQDYLEVEPYNRIFVWADDIRNAVAELNLKAAK